MTGYTKLFSSLVASTIWREDDKTRILWITMLAMKNREHVVEASIPGLADFSRMSISDCEAALEKLKSPDPYSRTKKFEGRRIEEVPGGWKILNGEYYRQKMSVEERREANRIYQQNHRRKTNVSNSADAPDISAKSPHTDADADPEVHIHREGVGMPTLAEVKAAAGFLNVNEKEAEQFFHHYNAVGWVDGVGRRITNWQSKLSGWKATSEAKTKSNSESSAGKVSLDKELDRITAELKRLVDGAASDAMGAKFYTEEDKKKITSLRIRRDEIKNKLGVKY